VNVGEIRHAIFVRQHGECISCGTTFTEAQMHMHERVFRGHGGEISLDNSEGLCFDCHLNRPTFGHGNRQPKFSKKVLDKEPESQ
jgi:5-methylcytosine-specific restriction endonuclease McrA